jgi:hypothetical protein
VIEPSSRRLVAEVAAVLRDRIAPLVDDDPWAASELRSIDVVLTLVAARLEHEAAIVEADNGELEALLAGLRSAGLADDVPAAGANQQERNLALRTALEASLHRLHAGHHAEHVAAVRRYLVAANEREQLVVGSIEGKRLF